MESFFRSSCPRRLHDCLRARQRLHFEQLEERRLLAGTGGLESYGAGTIASGADAAGEVIYRINVGGPQLTDAWLGDLANNSSVFTNSATSVSQTSFTNTSIDVSDPAVPADTPAAVFQSGRWDPLAGQEMGWDFPIVPGDYLVRLYFAETSTSVQQPARRVFDVSIEGATVLQEFDVYGTAGGYAGVVESFNVASDANLDIDFAHQSGHPALKGIEILRLPVGQPNQLFASTNAIDFENVNIGQSVERVVTLTNGGLQGDPFIVIGPSQTTLVPADAPYNVDLGTSDLIFLEPGESTTATITYSPSQETTDNATWQVPHTGSNSPLTVSFSGRGVILPTDVLGPLASATTVTPPVARVGPITLRAAVSDVGLGDQHIAAAEYFVDAVGTAGTGMMLSAEDGAFDSPSELVVGEIGRSILADLVAGTHTVFVRGQDSAGNWGTVDAATLELVDRDSNGEVVYRINVGGPLLRDSLDWELDSTLNPSPFGNAAAADSTATSTSFPIDLSDPSLPPGIPQAVLQSSRQDPLSGNEMEWDFPVAPGDYEVRLYWAESGPPHQLPGVRIFDVAIEGITVLDDFDIFAEVGGHTALVKSFNVSSDANLDIDLFRQFGDPILQGLEIIRYPAGPTSELIASDSSLSFGNVQIGQSVQQLFTLSNAGEVGDPNVIIDPQQAGLVPTAPFHVTFQQLQPIVLQPGKSTTVAVTYTPTVATDDDATLQILHNASNSPTNISLHGTGSTEVPISFTKSVVTGVPELSRPTSLQFGPDERLYVSQQNGLLRVYDIVRNGPNDYQTIAAETITLIREIPNHNDDGLPNGSVNSRLVTGMIVTGSPSSPTIYVSSSDPRIGAGPSGTDLNLDTNSGVVSRLTWNGSNWERLDLVRGLPRSEENHGPNGLQLDPLTNTLYLAQGGHTNQGGPSNNFAFLPEFALSAAILSIDLETIGESTYDLPTLDDEDRPGLADQHDPFGGNNGKNQALLVPGGPVQVYAPGFRNPFDLLITQAGKMFTFDNGSNAGWGDLPDGEGPAGNATNQTVGGGTKGYRDSLHFIAQPGYYGGHANPTRSNPSNTFNDTNPQSPVSAPNPIESDFQPPNENGSLVGFTHSTNGLAEYTAGNFGGALQGDLLAAGFNNTIKRIKLNASGNQVVLHETIFNNVGRTPLDVITPGGSLGGTIWVADLGEGQIVVFEPSDGIGTPGDADGDGYSDADELDNGTNPFNSADVPPDNDIDFVSNVNDPDDDNDTLIDLHDPFAIDASNGEESPIGTLHTWENDAPSPGGLFNLGFTGLMINGSDDYETLFDPQAVTPGGAAGVFTIDSARAGTARAASNDQEQAFQFGVNVSAAAEPFVATTSVLGPFSGTTPLAGQEMGIFVGSGDQDNYVQLVLSGDNGGEIQVVREFDGIDALLARHSLLLPGPQTVDLRLTIDPADQTLQASYFADGGSPIVVGPAVAIPADWLTASLAVGLISTDPWASLALPVTWDFLGIVSVSQSSAVAVTPETGHIIWTTASPLPRRPAFAPARRLALSEPAPPNATQEFALARERDLRPRRSSDHLDATPLSGRIEYEIDSLDAALTDYWETDDPVLPRTFRVRSA